MHAVIQIQKLWQNACMSQTRSLRVNLGKICVAVSILNAMLYFLLKFRIAATAMQLDS
jgi:hypothetical protein